MLEKDLTAVTYDKESGIITLPLSQEDTLLFSDRVQNILKEEI